MSDPSLMRNDIGWCFHRVPIGLCWHFIFRRGYVVMSLGFIGFFYAGEADRSDPLNQVRILAVKCIGLAASYRWYSP